MLEGDRERWFALFQNGLFFLKRYFSGFSEVRHVKQMFAMRPEGEVELRQRGRSAKVGVLSRSESLPSRDLDRYWTCRVVTDKKKLAWECLDTPRTWTLASV